MSTVITDNLTGKTAAGDVTITAGSATMQLQQGVAKAWATIDAYQATTGTTSSFNISSTTDDGAGLWDNAFTNNMNSVPYIPTQIGTGGGDTDLFTRVLLPRGTVHTEGTPTAMLTSQIGFKYLYTNSSSEGKYGYSYGAFTIDGDLA